MPAPRSAPRRKTETMSLKLFLTAATLSLTVGGWGAISHLERDADGDAAMTTNLATDDLDLGIDLDLPPLPRLVVPPAPAAPVFILDAPPTPPAARAAAEAAPLPAVRLAAPVQAAVAAPSRSQAAAAQQPPAPVAPAPRVVAEPPAPVVVAAPPAQKASAAPAPQPAAKPAARTKSSR